MTTARATRKTRAIGVVLPIHNEEEVLAATLHALGASIAALPMSLDCRVALVLDSCSDSSAAIARRWGRRHRVLLVQCDAANVGAARRAGCNALLRSWPRLHPRHVWLSTTDADSQVPRQWLAAQTAAHQAGANLWTGRVAVKDWSRHGPDTAQRWTKEYDSESAPVHGASMGISAQVYLDIGGFDALLTGEDRDLYFRACAAGVIPHHDTTVNVVTSARRVARAPLGFAHVLATIEREVAGIAARQPAALGCTREV
jgi:glycosyltransferase involved in cell wall biosynthesis